MSGIMHTVHIEHIQTHTDTCSHSHIHSVNVTEERNLFLPLNVAGAAFSQSQLRAADIKKALGETIYTHP